MNTSTEKLVMAMRVLAEEIQSDDGVANAAIHEAALRLEQQNDKIKRLEDAGDALKAAGYFGGWGDAVNKWVKVKEEKP